MRSRASAYQRVLGRPPFLGSSTLAIPGVRRLTGKDELRYDMTEQQLSHYEAVNGSTEPADPWRNEVQDRLARYKRRRGRRIEGAFTMRFPFPADDPAVPADPSPEAVAVASAVADLLEQDAELPVLASVPLDDQPVEFASETATEIVPPSFEAPAVIDFVLEAPPVEEIDPGPFVDPHPRSKPKRKVIAFPRPHSVTVEAEYRLADPVTVEVPRILDVPEELEATPFLDGLQLDLPQQAASEPSREHVELPCQPVGTSHRVFAGAIDLAITAIAAVVFSAVAFEILAELPPTKILRLGLVASLVVLWSAYQYLFVVYAGRTLGMMAARVRLRTFKGKSLTMKQRKLRVLSLYLSSLSLGMGLMWAFVDVDSLCWHDRLSQTFLTRRD
jgi:uncharacterized RDD family membrane protein YckC